MKKSVEFSLFSPEVLPRYEFFEKYRISFIEFVDPKSWKILRSQNKAQKVQAVI